MIRGRSWRPGKKRPLPFRSDFQAWCPRHRFDRPRDLAFFSCQPGRDGLSSDAAITDDTMLITFHTRSYLPKAATADWDLACANPLVESGTRSRREALAE